MRREQRSVDTGFARGHSVARVLAVGVPLSMFLVWWGVWGRHADVRSVSETAALVASCEGRTCLLRVASGEQVRVFRARNMVPAMNVRVTRTEYTDGKLRFDVVTAPRPTLP